MPKKAMEILTESMFYVLMAFRLRPMCGIDVADYIEQRTQGRLQIGPATLYTILAKFEKEQYIRETQVEGRKRTYCITEKGAHAYDMELERLKSCVLDAENAALGIPTERTALQQARELQPCNAAEQNTSYQTL